jgi:hypothetical protein
MPRNPAKPGHFSNYGLSAEHDDDLSAWMQRRLRLTLWPHANAVDLDAIETAVLVEVQRRAEPREGRHKVADAVKAARRRMAEAARGWTGSEGGTQRARQGAFGAVR